MYFERKQKLMKMKFSSIVFKVKCRGKGESLFRANND